MRGGLWQKQKRPSACLLCTYSYRQHLRPVVLLRTYSILSKNGNAGPIKLSVSTRPTIARQELLHNDVRQIRLSSGWGGGSAQAIKQEAAEDMDDEEDLLPHELAAREAARKRLLVAKEAPPKPKPVAEVRNTAPPLRPLLGVFRPAAAGKDGLPAGFSRTPLPRVVGTRRIDNGPAPRLSGNSRAQPRLPPQPPSKVPTAENGPVLQRLLDMNKIKKTDVHEHLPTSNQRISLPPRPLIKKHIVGSPSTLKPIAPLLGRKPTTTTQSADDLWPSVPQPKPENVQPQITTPTPPPESTQPGVATAKPRSSWGVSSWGSINSTMTVATGNSTQEDEIDDGLLPHERAARQAASATLAAANPTPTVRQAPAAVEAYDDLLPHERAAKQAAWSTPAAAKSTTTAETDDGLLPHERAPQQASSVSSSQSSLARRVVETPSKVWTPTSPPTQRATDQQWDALSRPLSSERAAPETPNQEWGQLTRRNKPDLARAFDFSQPARSSSRQNEPTEDPWDKLTQAAAKPKEAKPSATNDDTWDWVGDHLKHKDSIGFRIRRVQTDGPAFLDARQEPDAEIGVGDNWRPTEKPDHSELPATEPPASRFGPGPEVEHSRWDKRKSRDEVAEYEKPRKPKNTRRSNSYEEEEDFDEEAAEERRRRKAERKAEKERQRLAALEGPTPILLPEFISVANLATALGEKVNTFVRQLEGLGFEDVSKDSILTGETAALVAQEYGFEPTVEAGEDQDLQPRPPPDDPSELPLRPPVVTIMGHVDHGKTTLLDYLRKSSIVSQEHGGITQHIGAFSVKMSTGKMITFLDTPGHAAFLSMRQRGANVTDMVVLVVAADDSVKPQTLEALKHARAARVPIIVAISKIDKPEANIDRVKADLSSHGVEIEDYGGDVQIVPVSGKTGQGMDDLEENILLLAELLDIRAETDGMAEGWVLESSIKPIGRVATVLIKRGTLRPGDFIVAGRVQTKIRLLRNEAGQEIDEAPPGTAVEILGWKDPPAAGDMVLQAPDEGRAKDAVAYRQEQKEREEAIAQQAEMEKIRREKEAAAAAAEAAKAAEAGDGDVAPPENHTKIINFTVKGDVHGSVEAVTASVLEQGNDEVRPKVLQFSTGQINPSDVEHASISGSTIINFNNPIPGNIKRMAEDMKVAIIDHNVIYHLVEEVRDKLSEVLEPIISWKVVGEAELLQVFPINIKGRKYKNIAGCRVRNGMITKNARCRVVRGGDVVHEGTIDTLKHGKKDMAEIKKGSECGLSFPSWDDFKEGDQIQVVEEVREKRRL